MSRWSAFLPIACIALLATACGLGDSDRDDLFMDLDNNADQHDGLDTSVDQDLQETRELSELDADYGASRIDTSSDVQSDTADTGQGLYQCCDSESPCKAQFVCARGLNAKGACVVPAKLPNCWRDEECGPGRYCSVTLPGTSTPECMAPAGPGTCRIQVPFGACCSDASAACTPFTGECVPGTRGTGSRCIAYPLINFAPNGKYYCFSDRFCGPFATCEGEEVCGCDEDCDPQSIKPGVCERSASLGCCLSDTDCRPGQDCVEGANYGEKVCLSPPETGCYRNSHCPDGTWCEGAWVAGCVPAEQVTAGWCAPRPGFGACCNDQSGCAEGLICSGNVCVALAPGECLSPGDCASSELCSVAFSVESSLGWMCRPGESIGVPELGICVAASEGGCCDPAVGCGEGLVCAPLSPSQPFGAWTKGICAAPADAGHCWLDDDCGPGGRCEDVVTCPCNASCSVTPHPGTCLLAGTAAGACCRPDLGCDDGLVCLEQFNNVCAEKIRPGHCWASSDCSANEICLDPYPPMYCGWREELGYQGVCAKADLASKGEPCGRERPCKTGLNLVCIQLAKCVVTDYGADCRAHSVGTCQNPAPIGSCWVDHDCESPHLGDHCEGSTLCDADDAPCPDAVPGHCVPGETGGPKARDMKPKK